MGEVGNIWIKIGAKWDEVEKATSAIDKAMVKIGDKLQKVGKDFSIAGGAITAGMGLIIAKTANLGDQFYDLSQRTGIAVETLSSFKLAADKSGTSIGGFATGMKGLSRVMFEAAGGGKEAVEAFEDIGVSATDDVGKLRPLDQVMLDVADRFASMEDGAKKNALAMKLFGKSGMDLIPMLNLGRKGLEENIEKMQRFGVVTLEEARAGDAFNDAMTELQAATGGLTRVIGNALIPTMTDLATKAADIIAKVSAWAREHPLLTKVVSGTVLAIGGLLTALGSTAYAIGTVLKHLPTLITGLKVIKAIALNPIAIIITVGIVTALKAISDFKKEFTNMRAAMEEAGKSKFVSFLEAVNSGWRRVALGIKDSTLVLSEANRKMREAQDTTISVKGALILLGDAFKAIKGAIEQGVKGPIVNLSTLFKEFGLKTRTELTAELAKAEAALKLLKSSAEATPGAIKALEDKIKTLKEGITGVTVETRSLAEQLSITFRADAEARIKKLNDALLLYRGKMTEEQIAKIRAEIDNLSKSMKVNLAPAAEDVAKYVDAGITKLEEMALKALGEIDKMADYTADDMASALDEITKGWEKVPDGAKQAASNTDAVWESTTDEMAKAFGEAFASILKDGLNFSNLMKALFQGMVNAIATLVGKVLSKAFTDVIDFIVGEAASAFTTMAAGVAVFVTAVLIIPEAIKTIGELFDWLGDKWDELIATVTETTWDPTEGMEEWEKAIFKIQDYLVGYQISLQEVEDSWSTLLGWAKRVGQEGSKAITDLIKAFRAAGKESQALNEYMQSWLKTIPDALSVLIAGLGDMLYAINRISHVRIYDKEKWAELHRSIGELGRLAVLTFNSMLASGMSWIDAVDAMREPLAALRLKYKELGMTASQELKELFKIVGITEKHKELFQAIDANRQILIALGNSAWLTADAFKTLTGNVVSQFHQARSAGLSVDESLRAMAPSLQALVNYAAAYGFQLDKQTLSLIRQAEKLGIVHAATKDTGTVMAEGFEKVCDILLAIAKILGADIIDLMNKWNVKAELVDGASHRIGGTLAGIGDTINDICEGLATAAGLAASVVIPGVKIPKYASGGIAWTPQLARIAEREPEIIMPLREYRAGNLPGAGTSLGAGLNGAVIHITQTINAQTLDRQTIDRSAEYLYAALQHQMLRQGV